MQSELLAPGFPSRGSCSPLCCRNKPFLNKVFVVLWFVCAGRWCCASTGSSGIRASTCLVTSAPPPPAGANSSSSGTSTKVRWDLVLALQAADVLCSPETDRSSCSAHPAGPDGRRGGRHHGEHQRRRHRGALPRHSQRDIWEQRRASGRYAASLEPFTRRGKKRYVPDKKLRSLRKSKKPFARKVKICKKIQMNRKTFPDKNVKISESKKV